METVEPISTTPTKIDFNEPENTDIEDLQALIGTLSQVLNPNERLLYQGRVVFILGDILNEDGLYSNVIPSDDNNPWSIIFFGTRISSNERQQTRVALGKSFSTRTIRIKEAKGRL